MHINEIVMRTVVDKKLTISDACIQIGVDRSSFMNWLKKHGRPDWFPKARIYKLSQKKEKIEIPKKKNRARKAIYKGMATAAASICGCTKDRECAYHYAKSLKEEFGMTHDNCFSFDRLYSEINYAHL